MILSAIVCSGLMRLKGMDAVFPIRNRYISSILFGIFAGALHLSFYFGIVAALVWYAGIVFGLPALGELRNNDLKVWKQTALRGAWNGVLLSLIFTSVLPLLAGLSMPIWYKIGFLLQDKWPNTFTKGTNLAGWAVGEWLFGAVLGASI